jgi:hypothetical protein
MLIAPNVRGCARASSADRPEAEGRELSENKKSQRAHLWSGAPRFFDSYGWIPRTSRCASLGLLFLLKLLDLATLALDLLLLHLDLACLLLGGGLLILQRAADHVSGACAERAANRRAGQWVADRRAHDRARAAAEHAAAQRPFGRGRHPLLIACGERRGQSQHHRGQCGRRAEKPGITPLPHPLPPVIRRLQSRCGGYSVCC